MADYFTKFSFHFPLPHRKAQQYALDLHKTMSEARHQDNPRVPESLNHESIIEDWRFTVTPHEKDFGLWVRSEDGGVDTACIFVRHVLRKFLPAGRVEFEWAHDGSSPRTDAYGGGAAIITAEQIRTLSTCEWLRENQN